MTGSSPYILLAEDEAGHAAAIQRAFRMADSGAEIQVAATLSGCQEALASRTPDLLLLDLNFPDGNALDLLSAHAEVADFPVLVMSSLGSEQVAVEAMKAGALDYIIKSPESFAAMPKVVDRGLREWRSRQERRIALQQVAEYEHQYRTLADSGLALIWTSGLDKLCTYFNRTWLTFTGRTLEQESGDGWTEGVHPEDLQRCLDLYAEAFDRREPFSREYRLRRADGEYRWLQDDGGPRYDQYGEFLGYLGHCLDITRRKAAEEQLRESAARNRALAESAHDAIVTTDSAGRIVGWNHGAETIFGYPAGDAEGQPLTLLIPERYQAGHAAGMARIASGGAQHVIGKTVELFGLRKDGSEFPLELSLARWETAGGWFVTGIIRDITGRKQAEAEKANLQAQLHQAQKLDSIGSLAGGVAHDINNVLGSIMAVATVHRNKAVQGSDLDQGMELVLRACRRGGDLVRGLLGFARKGLAEAKVVNLNTLVKDHVALLERTTLQKVRVHADLAPDLHEVHGDPTSLSHAVMNLCVNAIQAMPEGGDLFLLTSNDHQGQVLLEIRDNGCGMPPEVLEKAFDPFFTTKPEGEGTGLGLTIVYGTVKAHNGRIEIRSEAGRGTTVSVRIPGCPQGSEAPAPVRAPRKHPVLDILIVDDDDLSRTGTALLFGAQGHRIVAAQRGEEALRRLERGIKVDVVILDINMPGIGGAETLVRLRALRPDLPVIIATGRPDQQVVDLVARFEGVTLIPKPFTLDEISALLPGAGTPNGGSAT